MGTQNLQQVNALNVRVWYVRGGVHPSRPPEFLSIGKFSDDPSKTIGEDTKVSAPDPNNFNTDIQVGTVPGEQERATLGIGSRSTVLKSIILDWANRRCRVDIYALIGKCGNPQNFAEGGEKFVYFPDGKVSDHAFENFGAFGQDENNPTNEMVSMTSEDYYEFRYERQDQIASGVTTREIYTIDTWSGRNCDSCPDATQNVFMSMAGASATPGTKPSLLYSSDGGENFSSQDISVLFSNETIAGGRVIGDAYVLISNTANAIVWTALNELYEGAVNTWYRVVSGFVSGKQPNAIFATDVRHAWIVGNGGYIYFAKNFQTGVEVQDAGAATSQHLRSVHAFDTQNILAVGDSNSVVFSSNGGMIWEAVTGPAVGVNLGACWMWDANTWIVGEGSGGTGKLWLTVNSGLTWTQIGLPVQLNRIDKIEFVSQAEGYISGRSGGQGYILRTITGGYEWYVLPQGKSGVAKANQFLSDLAVTDKYSNTVYACGLATNGTAGIALKMAG